MKRKPVYTTTDARRVIVRELKRQGLPVPTITDATLQQAAGDLTAYSITARDVDTLKSSCYRDGEKLALHPAIGALPGLSTALAHSLAALGLTLDTITPGARLGTQKVETR